MATRTKMTPFARLFIFLIIFLPLAYIGAAYYNGEDPLAKLQSLGQSSSDSDDAQDTYDPATEIRRLKAENTRLKEELDAVNAELEQLKSGSSSSNRQKWGN